MSTDKGGVKVAYEKSFLFNLVRPGSTGEATVAVAQSFLYSLRVAGGKE